MLKTIFKNTSLALCVLVSSHAYAQIPVIPGASGFGISTPAGRGGRVIRVTNLGYDGTGSLKACIDATGPRVCVFEVSGAISLRGENLSIRNPYITIAGQTAPSPGIMLRDGSLRINASNVLVQHIAVRVGDSPIIAKPNNADALKIESANGLISNIVVDHVSLSWGMDETLSVYGGAGNVTIRNSIISESLRDTFNENGPAKGALFGRNKSSISMIGNLLAHHLRA